MSYTSRPLTSLADDLDGLNARCAKLADMSFGLSMLFGALVAVSAAGGLWLHEPLLATSAGFAMAASAAFGLSGQALSRAATQAPRIRVAAATVSKDRRRA
jgi:short subunit fatty acids transporter